MKTTKLGRNLVLWMALGDGTLNANGYFQELRIRKEYYKKEKFIVKISKIIRNWLV